MAGQFDKNGNNTFYWTLTPYSTGFVRYVANGGYITFRTNTTGTLGSRPSMNLKSNVIITGGDGTKNSPFQVKLGS